MTTALDSTIFGPLFADAEINQHLTDQAYVRALVEVEIALAKAEAKATVIPFEIAHQIAKASADAVDLAALSKGALRSGFPIIALVQEIKKQVGPKAAPYVHWGATTQDIMDTACVLQMRAVVNLLRERFDLLEGLLSEASDKHRLTVMAGRTHSQQALPITLGLKVANWLEPIIRHRQRLQQLIARLFVVQFGGAAGTLAALEEKGLLVMHALADELHLGPSVVPWHAQRDNFVEFAGWLSLVTGSLGKMAQDVILMTQTEVAEVMESGEAGRGGSSTMPQKSNPIASELILAAARTNAALLSAMHQGQIHEHERATHGWQVEWLTLPQMMMLTGGAVQHAAYLARHLQVDKAMMRDNIHRAFDVVMAEAAVFALAKKIERDKAEQLVKEACARAVSEERSLVEVLKETTKGTPIEGAVDWEHLSKPEHYLGETAKIIDAVLRQAPRHTS